MRGKGVQPRDKRVGVRITPAYAGKSSLCQSSLKNMWDHPRVCGEKHQLEVLPVHLRGSPPRMRGKEGQEQVSGRAIGITPAYAGKRKRFTSWATRRRDHPRVCGEKIYTIFSRPSCLGSPPRMRGKAPSLRDRRHWHRITPAYAGKSCVLSGRAKVEWDHPRVCGEKHLCVQNSIAVRGITPAYAGKSIF